MTPEEEKLLAYKEGWDLPEPIIACTDCAGTGKSICNNCDGTGMKGANGASWYAWMLARTTCKISHGDAAKCDDCKRVATILIERARER